MIHLTHNSSHTQLISHHSSHPQLISPTTQLISHTTHLTHLISQTCRLARAVHRASWRSCGADCRRLGRGVSLRGRCSTQSGWAAVGRRSARGLLKELWRGLSPAGVSLNFAWQMQRGLSPAGPRRLFAWQTQYSRASWRSCTTFLTELQCGLSLAGPRLPTAPHHSSHTTHLTPPIAQHSSCNQSSHTTHPSPVIPYHSSHTTHLSPVTPHHTHLKPFISYHSSHSTHHTTAHLTTTHLTLLIKLHSSHTIHPTALIPHNSYLTSHLIPFISQPLISHHLLHTTHLTQHLSYSAHLTPLISQRSSHATYLTALISHHASHSTHLTSPLSQQSSHSTQTCATHLTQLNSYQTHIQVKDTKLHMWGYPVLLYCFFWEGVMRSRCRWLTRCGWNSSREVKFRLRRATKNASWEVKICVSPARNCGRSMSVLHFVLGGWRRNVWLENCFFAILYWEADVQVWLELWLLACRCGAVPISCLRYRSRCSAVPILVIRSWTHGYGRWDMRPDTWIFSRGRRCGLQRHGSCIYRAHR